jgi:hypothetical protein
MTEAQLDKTKSQYFKQVAVCKNIFVSKNQDYGTAWRILRGPSITDQIFIKAQRIRSIEQTGKSKVKEGIESEFVGIINYSIIALINLTLAEDEELTNEQLINAYDHHVEATMNLMLNKNHDYGEAWRDMRVSTFTDLILMKILRTRQIEDNDGKTLISEGIDANYQDMINYAIFALIRLDEQKSV